MWTVEYYPPGREDTHVYWTKEKPSFVLVDEPSGAMHTLMCSFVPTNGASRGRRVMTTAASCLVGETVVTEEEGGAYVDQGAAPRRESAYDRRQRELGA